VALGKNGAPGELMRKFDPRAEQTCSCRSFRAADYMDVPVIGGTLLRQFGGGSFRSVVATVGTGVD
jgi:hypothetical protein